MDSLVNKIAEWSSETSLAYFPEIFTETLFNIGLNHFIELFNINVKSFGMKYILGVSDVGNASTMCNVNFFGDDLSVDIKDITFKDPVIKEESNISNLRVLAFESKEIQESNHGSEYTESLKIDDQKNNEPVNYQQELLDDSIMPDNISDGMDSKHISEIIENEKNDTSENNEPTMYQQKPLAECVSLPVNAVPEITVFPGVSKETYQNDSVPVRVNGSLHHKEKDDDVSSFDDKSEKGRNDSDDDLSSNVNTESDEPVKSKKSRFGRFLFCLPCWRKKQLKKEDINRCSKKQLEKEETKGCFKKQLKNEEINRSSNINKRVRFDENVVTYIYKPKKSVRNNFPLDEDSLRENIFEDVLKNNEGDGKKYRRARHLKPDSCIIF